MTLALILCPVVVPGLVAVRRPLPGVLENSVDHRFADQDAQVHYEEGVHRPVRTEGRRSINAFRVKLVARVGTLETHNCCEFKFSCYLNRMGGGQILTPASAYNQQSCVRLLGV